MRIAEIKAASGGRAKVYSWNVGAPDNKEGVEPEYIARVSSFLLGCGFDGWISAIVPQTVDENRLAIRTRRVAEAHDAVLAEVRRTNAAFQGSSHFSLFSGTSGSLSSLRQRSYPRRLAIALASCGAKAETEEVASIFAQGVAA